jgi:2-methylisocitrate lyase-like PEP mutase family enzyme
MIENSAVTLRARLSKGDCLVAPGIYDPFSALIVEKLGFEALYLGGNALGLHLGVGQPFVTLTETVEVVEDIRRVSRLPVIVDAGAGFGDAAHAHLSMRSLKVAGAAAIHIDDQVFPKRAHYHRGKGHLADSDTVCGKLRAVTNSGGEDGPLVIARTDALRVTNDVTTTIVRCRQYIASGAEALMVLDLGPDRIAPFRKEFPRIPIFWLIGLAQVVPTRAELAAAGFTAAVYPFNTIGAVHEAVVGVWRDFKASGRPASFDRPATAIVADALEVIGLETALAIERSTTESEAKK